MMMLKKTSLVQQVKELLRERIHRSEFADGRIPPEAELARELNVSRNTVRDALSRLEAEGVVVRRHGAGTFVNQVGLMVKTRLQEITPYESLIRAYNHTPTVRLLETVNCLAGSLGSVLHCSPDVPILLVKKLFLADEQPVILTETFIPRHLIQAPFTPDDLLKPVFEFLPRFCHQELAYFLTELTPMLAPDWVVKHLRLPPDSTAMIVFEEIGYNPNNEPLLKACSYFRDDFLRLRLIRQPPAI
ncbi:MAG: GntR family transcriptional regulator [Chloroflexi bacterium]|nr:MAG: GntR family transcriptional regulator [Chloroflexota bacterium]